MAQQAGSAGDYLQAVAKMQAVSRQIVRFFDCVDVLVLPTYMHSPIRIGEWNELSPEATLEQIIHWIAPCPPFNAAGTAGDRPADRFRLQRFTNERTVSWSSGCRSYFNLSCCSN